MTDISMYFQVHQPMRLRRIKAFHEPPGVDYWDHATNQQIMDRAADKCYLPANRMLLDLIRRTDGAFRCAFSISGVFLEQAERYRPDVIESFRELARTGCVEFLSETYYHSLASLHDPEEFKEQVAAHERAMCRLIAPPSKVFRNTELVFDDRIARQVADMGYEAIITEGADRVLGDRLPGHVYRAGAAPDLRVLLKNHRLSDDIAFRFSSHDWVGFPLTADKYAQWLADTPGDLIGLFMDYETFGEHQWQETGIFDFLWHLPGEVSRHPHLRFATPSELLRHEPVDDLHVDHTISWADTERDVSAWLGNRMQHNSFRRLGEMAEAARSLDDPEVLHAWRLLQTSDHLYYACTKGVADGDIHHYFSPYTSPYLAYINHVNAIEDLTDKVRARARHEPVSLRAAKERTAFTVKETEDAKESWSDELLHASG